jgi:site-specific DNA-methyltransferase (adenine-specific)
MERQAQILIGDALETLEALPAGHARTCVCSPPYWGLRDYGVDGQLGLEATPDEYVTRLVEVFREVRRVLAEDGTLWLNLGDSYARDSGSDRDTGDSDAISNKEVKREQRPDKRNLPPRGLKPKDLVGIPWRVALALQNDGWWLRSDIIWHKPNPMPESVKDRPTSSHEHIFLLSKSKRYYYDADAVKETADKGHAGSRFDTGKTNGHMKDRSQEGDREDDGTRNKRDVWTVSTKPYPEAHFAVYPPDLIEPCIEAGSAEGDTVLDPFAGAGTTGLVALAKGRSFTGIELNEEYAEMARDRIRNDAPLMNEVTVEPASVLGAE